MALERTATARPGRGYRSLRCAQCGLPQACRLATGDCPCARFVALENRTRVTILAHYSELRKPTNTSKLAALLLRRCRVLSIGDPRSPHAGNPRELIQQLDAERTLLLFPSPDAEPLATLTPGAYELVVPDGTWAQTRRMVRRYADLQRLRAVKVDFEPTRYLLRRNAESGLLCTLEAVARALSLLDGAALGRDLETAWLDWQTRALAMRTGSPSSRAAADRSPDTAPSGEEPGPTP